MIFKSKNGIEIECEIIRKKNKNIYFRIKEDLKLYINAPMYLSQNSIMKLLNENEEAILNMYEKQKIRNEDLDKYILLGKKYYIKVEENIDSIKFDDKYVYVSSLKALDEYTNNKMMEVFTNEVDLCKKCFQGLPEFSFKIRNMKTRWGVCNTKNKVITLNSELIKKDIDLIDYVIIHELCHFFEGNHSKQFWDLVSMAYPKYKEARKRLRL